VRLHDDETRQIVELLAFDEPDRETGFEKPG